MKTVKRSKPVEEKDYDQVSIQEKFKLARLAMTASLVERDAEIDLVLTAMLAKEHCLFVGPPGLAKSVILDDLTRWLDGSKVFSRLLTKFTTPEEIFGFISVQGLREDKYRRITTNKLPRAELCALDEIWKASSAILNTLLRILNERVYENDDGTYMKCPLLFCLAASNEWPNDDNGGKELGAIFDRFLFRKVVRPVSKTGKRILIAKAVRNDPCKAVFPAVITPEEIDQAHQEAMGLPWPQDTDDAFWKILETLAREQICPSDRRVYKAVAAARAHAYLQGGKEVRPEHLEVLMHVLWDDPTEQPMKCEKIVISIANPLGERVFDLHKQAQDIEDQADKQLQDKNFDKAGREGVCQGVLVKLDEIKKDLSTLKQDDRRNRVLDYVQDAIKNWQYKLINARRD